MDLSVLQTIQTHQTFQTHQTYPLDFQHKKTFIHVFPKK
jgi:hypothetical protein